MKTHMSRMLPILAVALFSVCSNVSAELSCEYQSRLAASDHSHFTQQVALEVKMSMNVDTAIKEQFTPRELFIRTEGMLFLIQKLDILSGQNFFQVSGWFNKLCEAGIIPTLRTNNNIVTDHLANWYGTRFIGGLDVPLTRDRFRGVVNIIIDPNQKEDTAQQADRPVVDSNLEDVDTPKSGWISIFSSADYPDTSYDAGSLKVHKEGQEGEVWTRDTTSPEFRVNMSRSLEKEGQSDDAKVAEQAVTIKRKALPQCGKELMVYTVVESYNADDQLIATYDDPEHPGVTAVIPGGSEEILYQLVCGK